MTVVKRNKRAKPDPELFKLADSLRPNYHTPMIWMYVSSIRQLADRTLVFAGYCVYQRQEADRPSVDRRMVEQHAALFHHLLEVQVARRISGVSTAADQVQVDRKAHTLKVEHVERSGLRAPQFTGPARRHSLMRQTQVTYQEMVGLAFLLRASVLQCASGYEHIGEYSLHTSA